MNIVKLVAEDADGVRREIKCDADGKLLIGALLSGDLQIGAVELKNGSSDQRAVVDSGGNLAVKLAGNQVTLTDRSGTIATGGTAQQLMAANADRRGFSIQNVSDGDLWFNSLTTAVVGQPSMKIAAGQLYEAPAHGVPVTAISIIGATTSQAFAAREW